MGSLIPRRQDLRPSTPRDLSQDGSSLPLEVFERQPLPCEPSQGHVGTIAPCSEALLGHGEPGPGHLYDASTASDATRAPDADAPRSPGTGDRSNGAVGPTSTGASGAGTLQGADDRTQGRQMRLRSAWKVKPRIFSGSYETVKS